MFPPDMLMHLLLDVQLSNKLLHHLDSNACDCTCPTTFGTYFSDFRSPEHWMPEWQVLLLCASLWKEWKKGNLDCFKWPELLYSIPPEQAYSCMGWDNGHTQFDAAQISEENMVA
jgi:hypothetical protein